MVESLRKLFRLLGRREKRQLLLLVAMLIINALIEVVGVGIIPAYVSVVAFPEKLAENEWLQALLGQPGEILTQDVLLYWGSALMLVFFSIKALYTVLLSYARARYVQNRATRLSTRLFRTYMRAPYVFHLDRNTAELLRNVSSECLQLGNKVLRPLIGLLAQSLVLVAILTLLAVSVPGGPTLWIGLVLATAVALGAILHRKLKDLGLDAQRNRTALVRSVQEGLGGVKEVRVLGREGRFVTRARHAISRLMAVQRFSMVVQAIIPSVMEWMAVVGLLGATLALFHSGAEPAQIVPLIALFAVALARLKGVMAALAQAYTQIRQNLVSVDVIYQELTDLERAAAGKATSSVPLLSEDDTVAPLSLHQELQVADVWYRYPGAAEFALQGVNLSIGKGEAVGFVGATGAGKSTLIDVILGVLSPTAGHVRADGCDIHANAAAWQADVGYVPQAIFLIDGTVRENIALGLGRHQIDDTAVERAARAAHLPELLDRLPQGLETVVGERGVRLSGGQRQRIAIARALYHNPDVLIMDEATSALDNATERSVMQAVDELKGERTVLIIAHRLNTVRNCDRIVFLQRGQVDAEGTYEELLAGHTDFRRLAEA